ncbi:MAG: 3'(2'),5'-bisphosphate nucleotidase CysQ, partial [Rhodobacteraceae bacterium]|nr:3'(2'),5'-bisphosphate nucleotidase CysQ [Paracoccaceae bacterium]
MDYSNTVPIIRDTALKAGLEIMHVYGSGDFGVDTKS